MGPLEQARTKRNLTQDALARIVQIHQGNYARIESGRASIDAKTADRIAAALEVPQQSVFYQLPSRLKAMPDSEAA